MNEFRFLIKYTQEWKDNKYWALIRLISTVLILSNASDLLSFIFAGDWYLTVFAKYPIYIKVLVIFKLFLSLVYIVVGIMIRKREEKGRVFLLFLFGVEMVYWYIGEMMWKTYTNMTYREHLWVLVSFLFCLGLIILFTRPKIKEQFIN